jgi:hypothetical protein
MTSSQPSVRPSRGGILSLGTVNRCFWTLLFVAALSVLSEAQVRYTVYRPQTTMPPQAQVSTLQEEEPEEVPEEYIPRHTIPISWETEYEYAMKTAEQSSRCLLIYICADDEVFVPEELSHFPVDAACRKFDTEILDDEFVRWGLDWYVLLKLPMDATITDEEGVEQSIYSLPGFEHMLGLPGLVVIDFARRDAPFYKEVVGILPFLRGDCPTPKQTETFLYLPPGTITQRTLTYAVRIHPDRPLSSDGEPLPIVVHETTAHALYQAGRGVLTHQNFGARSNRVREVLGGGSPSEICAQSQAGISLFEGAIACMRLWRYSSAHWSIARKSHTYYGYDMARGRNGSWYAVGFFMNLPTRSMSEDEP